MADKEVKQEYNESESSEEEEEFYWGIFNLDLCDIICKDKKSLFTVQSTEDDNTDSIYLGPKQQQIAAEKKKLKENAKILLSNVYGKMFILYPQHSTLITFDSIATMQYLDQSESDSNPDRGICPPNTLYRVFNNIKGHKMRLSPNDQYIALCSHTCFNIYHISQFFNESNPKPLHTITENEGENILEFDWNNNTLFLVIDTNTHERILKHYSLSQLCAPKYIQTIPNIPHKIIMEIKLLSNNIFALCLRNGFVIFYTYALDNASDSDARYQVIHTININNVHKDNIKSKCVPYLITHMKECKQLCIHYAIQSEQSNEKYIPYFCIFKYDTLQDLSTVQCILSDHTGFNDISHKDMSLSSHEGIKSLYMPYCDYLIFCCKHDYALSIYGPKRQIMDCNSLTVKYDQERANANICDIAMDYSNDIPCLNPETEQCDLPSVPILYCLTNKLNLGCFNIVPFDENFNDKQSMPIMHKPIRSLPPIPRTNNTNKTEIKMSAEILNKYKLLYTIWFTDIYNKYAPEKVGNVANVISKYGDSYAQLQQIYSKLVDKYKVNPNEIKPLISIQEIETMQFDQNGNIIIAAIEEQKRNMSEPQTPKMEMESKSNDNSSGYLGFPDCNNQKSNKNESIVLSSFDGFNAEALKFVNESESKENTVSAVPDLIEISPSKTETEVKEVIKEPFSSAIFDTNVPKHEVRYEFFNAFKQIQVQMETLRMESKAFTESMHKTAEELCKIDECTAELSELSQLLLREKETRNKYASELFESELKIKHQKMCTLAMQLQSKCEKLKDKTYTAALKRRGLDETQEQRLDAIKDKINASQAMIDELRMYKNDETDFYKSKRHKNSPNYIFQRCIQVHGLVKNKFEKYLNLIEAHAPHLLIKQLTVTPKKKVFTQRRNGALNSFTASMRHSLPATPNNKNDILSKKYKNLYNKCNKTRFNSVNHRMHSRHANKLSKYEKRLNYTHNQTLKAAPKYNYRQFMVTPKSVSARSSTTQSYKSSPVKSDKASPNKSVMIKKHNISMADISSFRTKIQQTPCKSCKKPPALHKLASEKQLSRQKSTILETSNAQKATTNLQFKRTPGFKTVKRENRRYFEANSLLSETEYIPPKKPVDFVPFSPEKKVEIRSEKKEEKQPLTPRFSMSEAEVNSDKPSLQLQPTLETASPIKTKESTTNNNIFGLTKTPPKSEEKSAFNWGNASEEKKGNDSAANTTIAITNPFASFTSNNDTTDESNKSATEIYKERITKIYQDTGQGQSDKLRKVIARIEGRTDKGSQKCNDWIHSLYVKICEKYKISPKRKMPNSNNNTGNNTSQSQWFGNSNNSNSWGAMTSLNTDKSGFGSMSNWNTSNQSQSQNQNQNASKPQSQSQSTNAFSSFGNNDQSNANNSWNWGGSNNQSNAANTNQNQSSNDNSMGFASTATSNQPSWASNNFSAIGNDAASTGNDPFAAFASGNSGFGSLLG